MKNVTRLMYAMLLLFFTLNCNDDDPIQYQLTTEANPEEGGSVSPASAAYNEGTEVVLRATANEEYEFKGWAGDAGGDENPMKIMMTDDMVITALFEKIQYALNIDIVGQGTVEQKVLQAKGSTDYDSGTQLELSAVPEEGWYFAGWSGDVQSVANPMEVSMDQAMNLTATFKEEIDLNISFDISGSGEVTTEFVIDPETLSPSVKLTAVPAEGWYFVHWIGIRDFNFFFGNLMNIVNPIEFDPENPIIYDPEKGLEVKVTFLQDDGSTTYIPDDQFEQALISVGIDDVMDDYVSNKAISRIEALDLSGKGIKDLTGIGGFISLQSLDAHENALSSVIFPPNPYLNMLNLANNELTELDVSGLGNFFALDLQNNPLTCVKANQIQVDQYPGGLVMWSFDEGLVFALDCDN